MAVSPIRKTLPTEFSGTALSMTPAIIGSKIWYLTYITQAPVLIDLALQVSPFMTCRTPRGTQILHIKIVIY